MRTSSCRIGLVSVLLLVGLLASSCATSGPASRSEPLPAGQAAPVLTREQLMAELAKYQWTSEKGDRTDVLIDRVLAQGPPGLEVLLDVFWPESSPASDRRAVAALVRDLDSDDYATCRRAAQRLYDLGSGNHLRLQQAAQGAGPAVVMWLTYVRDAWRYSPMPEPESYQRHLSERMAGIEDPRLLNVLLGRAQAILKRAPLDGIQEHAAEALLVPLAKSGDDRFSAVLAPYLREPDARVAVLVTRAMASGRGNTYCPPLLLEALRSDRPEVVHEALRWTPNVWDDRRRGEVHRLLRRIFEGQDEPLKFEACFPLMHGYQDKDARAFLIRQTHSPNRERARTAIVWLGDAVNTGRRPEPELIEGLVPYLESEDAAFRREAADTLGTYAGEEIVRLLVPLLADKEQVIVDETSRHLLDQRDKAMLRRVLAEARDAAAPGPLRDRIAQVLGKVPEK
ncbi:MAG TPA: HEAT repeat domain-containing protein [Phycisphaerae bacterium]|nr:HEAT repeat domain-containing protein [Phycisphaerae bacterium]